MFDGVARPVSPYRLDHCDIAEVNREIVAAASGYAFERLGEEHRGSVQTAQSGGSDASIRPDAYGQHRPATHNPGTPTKSLGRRRGATAWPVERWFQAAQTSI